MALLTAAPVFGQTQPLECMLNGQAGTFARSNEISALLGNIQIECRGGTPTPVGQAVPSVDVQVFLNADYTGRVTGNLTESLLLIDVPAKQAQVPCVADSSLCGWTGGSPGPNVFQGRLLAPNALLFPGIPLDPPGDGQVRVLQITNLRANASSVPLSSPPLLSKITASVSMSGLNLLISSGDLAMVTDPIRISVLNAAGDGPVNDQTGAEFPNCTAVTKQRFANLRIAPLNGNSLRRANWAYDGVTGAAGPPEAQADLNWYYTTESGFFNPDFPSTNHLNQAGLASSGTRLRATFTGLPAGATLYASTVAVTYTNGVPAASGADTIQIRMASSETGVFAPVAATETLDGLPAVALPVTQGTATAVWEVVAQNAQILGNVDIPLWVSLPGQTVGLGTASVAVRLAPVSTETGASETAPQPRFADNPLTLPLLTTLDMCPSTQYLVTTSPAFLPVVVDGQTYTSPKSFLWQAGSTHTISAAAAVQSGVGVRQALAGWSDGGAQTHTITVPAAPATYTATYKTQYLLDAQAAPADGGTLTITPASADGYYDPGTTVQLRAATGNVYTFLGYTGDAVFPLELVDVAMWGPRHVTANFQHAAPLSHVVSLLPASGSGSDYPFSAVFEGAQGAQSLQWVQVLLAAAPDGGGQSFCFVHYDVQGQGLWLYSDNDGFFHGPVSPGQVSATLQSSTCAFDPASAFLELKGSRLTFAGHVLLKKPGARNVYLRAFDLSGVDTGWVQLGAWTQEAVGSPQMTMQVAGDGNPIAQFTLTITGAHQSQLYSAHTGWQQFLLAAGADGGGQPFCFVHFDRAARELWMYSSDVGFFLGPVTFWDNTNALDSSACTVVAGNSSAYESYPSSSVLSIQLSLKAPMQGAKKMFMRTLDPLMTDSGWVEVGAYQVP